MRLRSQVRAFITLVSILLLSPFLTAQNVQNKATIFGVITNASTNEELDGVNVTLKENFLGTTTNRAGEFSLDVQAGEHTLVISYLGFKSEEYKIDISAGERLEMNIALEEAPYKINEIQLSGKSQIRKINEQAYAVSSISTEKLLNSTADVQQVLDRVPGVRILEEGGLGSNYTFSLNGFSGNQVKFFLNGLPMDSFGPSFNLGNIPVNSIERIDVYNGVVPVWLGTDALGGAVNIVTNQKDEYLDVSYSIGSFNTHRASVNGAYTDDESGFTVRGNLNYNYSDNNYKVDVDIRDANGNLSERDVEVERFHDRYQSATAKLEAGFVDRSFADQLLLGLMVSADDRQVQTGATMASVFGAIKQESESVIPTLKYRKEDLFTEGLDVGLNTSYNITQTRNIDTLTGITYNWYGQTFNNGSRTNGEQGMADFLEQDDHDFNSQLTLSYLFNKKHSLSFNYAFQHFSRDEFDRVNLDRNAYFLPKSLAKNVFGLAYKYQITKNWTSTFFGKAYGLNVKTSQEEGNAIESTVPVKVNYSNLGYGFASSYFLLENLQLKVSYEKAFRLPTAEEFFGNGITVLPNVDLKPEESDNLNIGANFSYDIKDNNFELGGTFIYRNTNNLIYNTVSNSRPTTTFQNLSETKAIGVEGTFAYRWRRIFNLAANITYQDITDQADFLYDDYLGNVRNFTKGARIPNTPYLFGGMTAGLNFSDVYLKETELFFNYYYRFTEEYFLSLSNYGDPNQKDIIPQQSEHSIELGYSLKDGKYNISLECRNLADVALYDRYRLQKPGRAFYLKLRYNL